MKTQEVVTHFLNDPEVSRALQHWVETHASWDWSRDPASGYSNIALLCSLRESLHQAENKVHDKYSEQNKVA